MAQSLLFNPTNDQSKNDQDELNCCITFLVETNNRKIRLMSYRHRAWEGTEQSRGGDTGLID